jgi:hypothetical protein
MGETDTVGPCLTAVMRPEHTVSSPLPDIDEEDTIRYRFKTTVCAINFGAEAPVATPQYVTAREGHG